MGDVLAVKTVELWLLRISTNHVGGQCDHATPKVRCAIGHTLQPGMHSRAQGGRSLPDTIPGASVLYEGFGFSSPSRYPCHAGHRCCRHRLEGYCKPTLCAGTNVWMGASCATTTLIIKGAVQSRTSAGNWMILLGPGCQDTIAIFI
jgi:hypothetical protein